MLGECVLRDPSLWSVVGVAAHGARSDQIFGQISRAITVRYVWQATAGMLRRVELTNFKAFERFTVYLRGDVFLVGPNNAGKSTLIAALRAGANMLRIANRLRATDSDEVDGSIRHGHALLPNR